MRVAFFVWIFLILLLLAGIFLIGLPKEAPEESITEVMRDGVLHEGNRMNLFGLTVNPGLISAFVVTGILLLAALLLRIFFIPRMKEIPGRFQCLLEGAVGLFSGQARGAAPRRSGFLGAYLFSVGSYIFLSTLFELFGIQAVTTAGRSVSLPAPISDINGALAIGCLSFLVILGAGIFYNGVRGGLGVVKDISLPVSMSFRLFGALLSGLLVTELVYYYTALSFVVPVLVGVLFTLLHAVIQTYVLTTLVSIFYGEASEPRAGKHPAGDGSHS